MSRHSELVGQRPLMYTIADRTISLVRLAQKLATEGPYKVEHTPRRVRALFNGKYVIDTLQAYHVWEHPNFPQYRSPKL